MFKDKRNHSCEGKIVIINYRFLFQDNDGAVRLPHALDYGVPVVLATDKNGIAQIWKRHVTNYLKKNTDQQSCLTK